MCVFLLVLSFKSSLTTIVFTQRSEKNSKYGHRIQQRTTFLFLLEDYAAQTHTFQQHCLHQTYKSELRKINRLLLLLIENKISDRTLSDELRSRIITARFYDRCLYCCYGLIMAHHSKPMTKFPVCWSCYGFMARFMVFRPRSL